MDKSDLRTNRQRRKELRSQFLEENDCERIPPSSFPADCCGKILNDFDCSTHEAWLVRCPKNVDVNSLVNKSIRVPGRRQVRGFQVRTVPHEEKSQKLCGLVNAKGKYKIVPVPISGSIFIKKRIPERTIEGAEDNTTVYPLVSEPEVYNLPVRHPFFGSQYKQSIKVPKSAAKQMRSIHKNRAGLETQQRAKADFMKIQTILLATSLTLEEKEELVRQSVLTGVKPKFMSDTEHPNYVEMFDLKGKGKEILKRIGKTGESENKRQSNGTKKVDARTTLESQIARLLDNDVVIKEEPENTRKRKSPGKSQKVKTEEPDSSSKRVKKPKYSDESDDVILCSDSGEPSVKRHKKHHTWS